MITSSVEKIGKQKALAYLQANTDNYRSISVSRAKQYAEDMKAGRWELNGEPIVFAENGLLKNGQHRLTAVVLADKEIPFLVVRGVQDDVNIYDFGANRNIRQLCGARNASITTSAASAARILMFGFHASASKGMQADYIVKHHDELQKAQSYATRGRNRSIGEKASVVLFIYVCRRLGLFTDELIEDFMWCFNNQNTKTPLRDASPALVAARMFLDKYKSGSAAVQLKQINILYQAMKDYKANKSRIKDYVPDNANFLPFINQVRRLDGFTETNN